MKPTLAGHFLIPGIIVLSAGLPGEDGGSPGDVGVDEKLGAVADLDLRLRDEEGKEVSLRGLLDKPTILTLNYFACAGICTPLLQGIQQVVNGLPLVAGKDYQVVTVSFDPKDTPEIAAQKRTNFLTMMSRPFPPLAWRFLTGEATTTKRLCDSVGFRFRAEGKEFAHPGVIVLLSPQGKITRYIYGTSFLPSDVELALREAAEGKVSATRTGQPRISDRWGQFCYSYDPVAQRYVFNMTKVVGLLTLVLVGAFVAFVLLRGAAVKRRETTRSAS